MREMKTEHIRGIRQGVELAQQVRRAFPVGSLGRHVMKVGVAYHGSPYVRLGYEGYLRKRGEDL